MATPTQGLWFIPCVWTKPGFLAPWAPSPRAPTPHYQACLPPPLMELLCAPALPPPAPLCTCTHNDSGQGGRGGMSITERGTEFHDGPFQAHLLPLPVRTLALSQADGCPPGFQLPLPHSQHFQTGEYLSHPQGLAPASPFMSAHTVPPPQAAEDALQRKWTLFLHGAGPQHTLSWAWERIALCGEHLEASIMAFLEGPLLLKQSTRSTMIHWIQPRG